MKLAAVLLIACAAHAATTTVSQTIVGPNGVRTSGSATITINTPCFSGTTYVSNAPRVVPFSNGNFSVALVANDSCSPAGTSYAVKWLVTGGVQWSETWVVPTSGSAVSVESVKVSTTPTPSTVIGLSQLSGSGASAGDLMQFNGSAWAHATTLTGSFTNTGYWNFMSGSLRAPEKTVATLPSAASSTGKIFVVTDGTSASDCTSGGGSSRSLCTSNGSAWVALGGGSAAWGAITGTLSNQTDLQAALDAKADAITAITGSTTNFNFPCGNGTTAIQPCNISQNASSGAVEVDKGHSGKRVDVTLASSMDIHLEQGNYFVVTTALNGPVSFNFLNIPAADRDYRGEIELKQDATGGRIPTFVGGSGFCIVTYTPNITTNVKFKIKDGVPTGDGCSDDDTPTYQRGPERSAQTTTAAGEGAYTFDSTSHTMVYYGNNSANRHAMPRIASGDQVAVSDLSDGSNLKKRKMLFTIDGGGGPGITAIAAGTYGWGEFESDGTITSYDLACHESGSIQIDLGKAAYASAPPSSVSGTTITASAKPTLSGGQRATDSTLTGWTTSVSARDFLRLKVDSATTVTFCTLAIFWTAAN